MREATGTKKRKVQQRGVCESEFRPSSFFYLSSLTHSHTMSPVTRRQKRHNRVNYAESESDHSDSEFDSASSSSSDMSEDEAVTKKTPTRSNQWAELQRARAQQRRSQWKAAVNKRKKPTIAPRSIKR